jgi:hypothetical protein
MVILVTAVRCNGFAHASNVLVIKVIVCIGFTRGTARQGAAIRSKGVSLLSLKLAARFMVAATVVLNLITHFIN